MHDPGAGSSDRFGQSDCEGAPSVSRHRIQHSGLSPTTPMAGNAARCRLLRFAQAVLMLLLAASCTQLTDVLPGRRPPPGPVAFPMVTSRRRPAPERHGPDRPAASAPVHAPSSRMKPSWNRGFTVSA
jgi:hypothetical protein